MHTILWIHGFPLSPAVFEKQLAIEGALHLMPPLPGFGGAEPPAGEVTVDDYARLMIGELDRRGIEKATFAGLSMGGYVCFAALRIAPERVERLVLIDTRETADDEAGRRSRFAMIDRVEREGPGAAVEAMLPKMLTAGAPAEAARRVREIMQTASQRGVVAALRAMAARPDASALLPEIRVPALVVVGAEDPITPPADAERMAGAIPGAQLACLPGAAHLANFEQPQRFNRTVAAFLGT